MLFTAPELNFDLVFLEEKCGSGISVVSMTSRKVKIESFIAVALAAT